MHECEEMIWSREKEIKFWKYINPLNLEWLRIRRAHPTYQLFLNPRGFTIESWRLSIENLICDELKHFLWNKFEISFDLLGTSIKFRKKLNNTKLDGWHDGNTISSKYWRSCIQYTYSRHYGYWLLSWTNIQLSILNENIIFLYLSLTQAKLCVSNIIVANQYKRLIADTEDRMLKMPQKV